MTYAQYRYLVWSDLYRITGQIRRSQLIRHALLGESYRYSFWMRSCAWMRTEPRLRYTLYPIALWMLRRQKYKLGISIPHVTEIGSGFYIGHFGGIVVNGDSRIGKNCNISHGVTIGQSNRGARTGCPSIGDNVYIGPGAKIFGGIVIGDNVAIGANCVVTRDVPDYAVVVGVPGKVISTEGSEGYVNRTDYDAILKRRRTSTDL